MYKHGLRHTILYDTWRHIRGRYYRVTDKAYKNYGGRGITVCDEWRNDPVAFYNWAMSNGWQKGLSLDRIDNDKGYSPDNCRWTDRKTQNNNRRCTPHITYNGETHTIKEWSEITGIKYHTLFVRIVTRGWELDRVFKQKPRGYGEPVTYLNQA